MSTANTPVRLVAETTMPAGVRVTQLQPAVGSLISGFRFDGRPLEDAFRFLEEEDAERVPVVDEHDRLIGVLSRSVLQRRLAEDEEPPDEDGDDEPPDLLPAA